MLKVGTFNLLADGLCEQEFFSVNSVKYYTPNDGGKDRMEAEKLPEDCDRFIRWTSRESQVLQVLVEMFEIGGCSIIVTQENDHFFYLLEQLRVRLPFPIGGVFGRNFEESSQKHSTSWKIWSQRQTTKTETSSPSPPHRTFREECGALTSLCAQWYGCDPEDPYLSDDGIGIYYRSDQLRLLEVSAPLQPPHSSESFSTIISSTTDQLYLLNSPHCVKCSFEISPSLMTSSSSYSSNSNSNSNSNNNNNSTAPTTTTPVIQVYGAHLTSGEEIKKEIERYHQLSLLLAQTVKDVFPILIMDSNHSLHYERQYPPAGSLVTLTSLHKKESNQKEEQEEEVVVFPGSLSQLITQYQFIDLVSLQPRNECLKMRNRHTNQLSKAFQLMFDTIDKILIRASSSTSSSVSFLKEESYQDQLSYRRYDLRDFSFFYDLRTNEEKRTAFHRYCREKVFVTCPLLAFFSAENKEEEEDEEEKEKYRPLLQLYPNQFACSDHPPIIATILLNS